MALRAPHASLSSTVNPQQTSTTTRQGKKSACRGPTCYTHTKKSTRLIRGACSCCAPLLSCERKFLCSVLAPPPLPAPSPSALRKPHQFVHACPQQKCGRLMCLGFFLARLCARGRSTGAELSAAQPCRCRCISRIYSHASALMRLAHLPRLRDAPLSRPLHLLCSALAAA